MERGELVRIIGDGKFPEFCNERKVKLPFGALSWRVVLCASIRYPEWEEQKIFTNRSFAVILCGEDAFLLNREVTEESRKICDLLSSKQGITGVVYICYDESRNECTAKIWA